MGAKIGAGVKVYGGGSPIDFYKSSATYISDRTYRLNDITKRMWQSPERVATIGDTKGWGGLTFADMQYINIRDAFPWLIVYCNEISVDPSNLEWIDYLAGVMKFKDSFTPSEPVTITGRYVPLTQLAQAKSVDLTVKFDLKESTTFEDMDISDFKRRTPTLADGSGTLNSFWDVNEKLISKIYNNENLYLRINFGVGEDWSLKALIESDKVSPKVEDLLENDVGFTVTEGVSIRQVS